MGQDTSKVTRDMNRGERQGDLERVDRADNRRREVMGHKYKNEEKEGHMKFEPRGL